jgi:hypothetical protein
MTEDNGLKRKMPPVSWIGIGLALGAGVGVALDELAIGVGLGLAFGAMITAFNNRRNKQDP